MPLGTDGFEHTLTDPGTAGFATNNTVTTTLPIELQGEGMITDNITVDVLQKNKKNNLKFYYLSFKKLTLI